MTHTEMIDDQQTDAIAGIALCPKVQNDSQPRDEFIATLAHELRTPLAAIFNSLQVMRQCTADEQPARQARDIVERQARHMARVIDDLLDICRSAHGKLSLRKEPVNVAAVVASAVERARAWAGAVSSSSACAELSHPNVIGAWATDRQLVRDRRYNHEFAV